VSDVLWGGILNVNGPVTVQGLGLQPGPIGGDAWAVVATLPRSKLQNNRHYAFVVTGHVHTAVVAGSPPVRGMVQVCLGDSGGLKHPEYRMQFAIGDDPHTGVDVARPFQFLVLFSSDAGFPITDPLWGPNWSNVADLVVWARCFANGDAANYSPTVQVSNITFLWWDLDAIPVAARVAEEYYPARPPGGAPVLNAAAGSGPTNFYQTAQSIGVAGQKWLHFYNLWFTPRGNGAGPARFVHGYTTDGTFGTFVEVSGSSLRWGTDTRGTWVGAGGEEPTQQFGSFAVLTRPSGAFALAFRGTDQHAVAGRQTQVYRWRVLSLRLELLPNFASLKVANGAPGLIVAANIGRVLQTPYVPWEPGPQQTGVTQCTTLVHGILVPPSVLSRSHAWWIEDNLGSVMWVGDYCNVRTVVEGVPVLGFAAQGLGQGGLDMVQYRFQFLRIDGEGGLVAHAVQDFEAVQFWFLQDPSIDVVPPAPLANPVVLVPSREGVALAAQVDLPIQPDWAIPEDAVRDSGEIKGETGYSRSWPQFSIGRRIWRLGWNVLRPSQFATLDAFFRANRTFRWVPPGDAGNAALGLLERPAYQVVDTNGPLRTAAVRVAELVHIGP
jgi:hypothetical protein